jgi:hypothetical protein
MATRVADLLGRERVLGTSALSNLELAHATRAGLPAQTALELAEQFRPVVIGPARPRPKHRRGPPIPVQSAEGTLLEVYDVLARLGPLGAVVSRVSDRLAESRLASVPAGSTIRRLTPLQSDVVFRTANALAKAIDVLGDKKKAVHWLENPNRALGGEVPIRLLDTSAGTREVEALLDRIEHGVYS